MNAGDRRGPLGSHSFILGHTPRLITSFYCAVSRSPARSFTELAPSALAIAIGRRKAVSLSRLASAHLLFAFRFSIDRLSGYGAARARHDGSRGAAANPLAAATAKSHETASRGVALDSRLRASRRMPRSAASSSSARAASRRTTRRARGFEVTLPLPFATHGPPSR